MSALSLHSSITPSIEKMDSCRRRMNDGQRRRRLFPHNRMRPYPRAAATPAAERIITRSPESEGIVTRTCHDAAFAGSLHGLKHARKHGSWWDVWTCHAAARRGSLECLKYAHENGCWWNEQTCWAAAGAGSLACLKYAHEHGCPWNGQTCWYATCARSLKCLRYARENGCPWNKRECMSAAVRYHTGANALTRYFIRKEEGKGGPPPSQVFFRVL